MNVLNFIVVIALSACIVILGIITEKKINDVFVTGIIIGIGIWLSLFSTTIFMASNGMLI